MIYFAKNSGQKPGTASLEYPLFHGSLPPYGYQAVTNVDFAGLNDYFYSPTGWETFNCMLIQYQHHSGSSGLSSALVSTFLCLCLCCV